MLMPVEFHPRIQNRRRFIATLSGVLAQACFSRAAPGGRRPRILLRSSWQTVNIGDIAHTPGFLTLVERHLPGVDTTLWPGDVGNGVRELLLERFPRLKIAESEAELEEAFGECDLLAHGSAASFGNFQEIERWQRVTGKGFGVYAVTFDDHQSWKLQPDSPEEIQRRVELLNRAEFAFFRDRESLAMAKRYGVNLDVMDFAPDAAFACDLRDEEKAEAYLKAHDLEEGKFLCCIPRLRFSPYWLMKEGVPRDEAKRAANERMKEQDHEPLRQAVRKLIRETDYKALLCPEDVSQIAVNKEMIYDRLSARERERVVWKSDYWLTGEAISTYVRSAGLFGNEMHSPIMCIGHGVPAIVCRWEGQTSKGTMWNDIGLGEWLFNFDKSEDRERMPGVVVEMAVNPEESRGKAETAREIVRGYQAKTMQQLGSFV